MGVASRPWCHLLLGLLMLSGSLSLPAVAREPVDLSGKWTGEIATPGTPLKFDIDFKRIPNGWDADISIPVQGAKDMALTDVVVDGESVSFVMPGVPGTPTFKGALDESGETISGSFTQGGGTLTFEMSRGEDRVAAAKAALVGFDDFVEKAIQAWHAPGLAIGIVVDDEIVLAKGYGFRDLEAKKPVTTKTLFAIGSSTKAFTALTLGTLVDEGKLDWDTPVMDYLPGFKLYDDYATTHITPRDLVTHRSGLPRHDLSWYNNKTSSRADLVRRLRYYEPTEELRNKFQYNNLMFMTAGYLAGHLTGGTWEDAVRTRIFEPLDMRYSNFSVEDSQKADDFAYPYRDKDDKVSRIPFRNIDNVGPAGSINSNVEDMLKWVRLHLGDGTFAGHKLLGKATLKELHRPQVAMGSSATRPELSAPIYAMGWMVRDYRGHTVVEHGGAIDGFISAVAFYPDDGIGIVAFTNSQTGIGTLMRRHAIDRILGLEVIDWHGEAHEKWVQGKKHQEDAEDQKDTFRHADAPPSHPLDAFSGTYTHPGYGDVQVAVVGEQLTFIYNDILTPFEHWHYDVFNGLENKDDPAFEGLRIQFRSNMQGDVSELLAPFEPSLDPIIFDKKADPRMYDPAYLKRFLGVYTLATQEVTFSLQGDVLTLTVPGQPVHTLEPSGADQFNLKGLTGFSVRFAKGESGAMSAWFDQPNGVFEATRKEEKE